MRAGKLSCVEFILCVGNHLLEWNILVQLIGDLIRNYTFSNIIEYCIHFEKRGRTINLNFNVATKYMNE